ncbi:Hypothetical protein H16_B2573 [Cupriavidus necator H16]|uniref:Uncharacterized protein n=1 Tax=Cupriavidus necator (strain ATCC 17699 / DSM 428 / KCTC 22496 / NCIMB 10442 / H16 / Stanier 337) TaxID=381666 RepID=Q0JY19_CUPNH|nr:Hypothetical protein H16_B2573 [Cupriavidus necator H16]
MLPGRVNCNAGFRRATRCKSAPAGLAQRVIPHPAYATGTRRRTSAATTRAAARMARCSGETDWSATAPQGLPALVPHTANPRGISLCGPWHTCRSGKTGAHGPVPMEPAIACRRKPRHASSAITHDGAPALLPARGSAAVGGGPAVVATAAPSAGAYAARHAGRARRWLRSDGQARSCQGCLPAPRGQAARVTAGSIGNAGCRGRLAPRTE